MGLREELAKLIPGLSQVPQVPGLLEPGNIDLHARPIVKNPDGTISTVKSMSFSDDGKTEILIPMISPSGTTLTQKGAIELYRKTGQHLGKFNSPNAADAYAMHLHNDQAKEYDKPSIMQQLIGH